MPFPKGTDPEKAIGGYIAALHGFPIEAIAHGIRRFLRGECEDVSSKFCPHPPELAKICRTTRYIAPAPPEPRGYVPANQELPGARERMRLKMPMYQYANSHGLMGDLDRANRDGFEAMIVLAYRWGIEVPEELLADPAALPVLEEQWRRARNRAWAEIEAKPPPFMRNAEKKRAEYADRPILHTDINFDQWKRLSTAQEVPVGAVWVASLGTVYGPKPKVTS